MERKEQRMKRRFRGGGGGGGGGVVVVGRGRAEVNLRKGGKDRGGRRKTE